MFYGHAVNFLLQTKVISEQVGDDGLGSQGGFPLLMARVFKKVMK